PQPDHAADPGAGRPRARAPLEGAPVTRGAPLLHRRAGGASRHRARLHRAGCGARVRHARHPPAPHAQLASTQPFSVSLTCFGCAPWRAPPDASTVSSSLAVRLCLSALRADLLKRSTIVPLPADLSLAVPRARMAAVAARRKPRGSWNVSVKVTVHARSQVKR